MRSVDKSYRLWRRIYRSMQQVVYFLLLFLTIIILYWASNVCSVCLDVSRSMNLRELSRHTGQECFYSVYEPNNNASSRVGKQLNVMQEPDRTLMYRSLDRIIERCYISFGDKLPVVSAKDSSVLQTSATTGGFDARISFGVYYRYFILYRHDVTILVGWECI